DRSFTTRRARIVPPGRCGRKTNSQTDFWPFSDEKTLEKSAQSGYNPSPMRRASTGRRGGARWKVARSIRLFRIVVRAFVALSMAAPTGARAGLVIARSGLVSGANPAGVVSSTSGVHVTGQSGPSGDWTRSATVSNSNNTPSSISDAGPFSGPYVPPSGGGVGSPLDSGNVSYSGGDWLPEGR